MLPGYQCLAQITAAAVKDIVTDQMAIAAAADPATRSCLPVDTRALTSSIVGLDRRLIP